MVLESLKPDVRVNIRNLTIENPKSPDPDPFKITEIDWQFMEKTLDHSVKNNNTRFAAELASAMVILSPQKREHIVSSYNLSVDYFTHRVNVISEVDGSQSPLVGPEYYAAIKILFPSSDPHKYFDPFKIVSNAQQEGERIVEELCDPDKPISNAGVLSRYKYILTLFPNLVQPKEIPQEKIDLLEAAFKNSEHLPGVLSNLRFSIPKDRLPLEMTKEDWEQLAAELTEARYTGNWGTFAQISKAVKILRADEVKITENGWEFKMPPDQSDFQTAPPPLPEARRF